MSTVSIIGYGKMNLKIEKWYEKNTYQSVDIITLKMQK